MTCHVYVIARQGSGTGPVKIGVATDVAARLRSIQTSAPFRLALVHQFACPDKHIARAIEKAFHDTQKGHQAHGEWFNIDPFTAVELVCIAFETALEVRGGIDLPNILDRIGITDARTKLNRWKTAQGILQ